MTIQEHIALKELTTLKIGGTARYFVAVASRDELKEALMFAQTKNLPSFVLGGGSNLLVAEGEIKAVIIKNEIKGVEWKEEGESVLVTAGAGESWDALVAAAVARGLWGIENLSGIPGTVGAAPVQNIGAYGTELADTLEWVETLSARLSLAECRFGYRGSIFKETEGKHHIITRVALRLQKDGAPNFVYKDVAKYFGDAKTTPTLAEIRRGVLEIRSQKFPDLKEFGTAGSFFKNPIISRTQFDELKKKYPEMPGFPLGEEMKIPLAWVLDNLCGLKGLRKGAVGLFPNQPIVLVNFGGANANEIRAFAEEIARCVKNKTDIKVEWEVQYLR